jgi:hypothetical protein
VLAATKPAITVHGFVATSVFRKTSQHPIAVGLYKTRRTASTPDRQTRPSVETAVRRCMIDKRRISHTLAVAEMQDYRH